MKYIAKSLCLAAILSCCITLNCTAAELELKQASGGPSYEDTVDFLKTKYNYINVDGENKWVMKIESIDKCVMKLNYVAGKVIGWNKYDLKEIPTADVKPSIPFLAINPVNVTFVYHYEIHNFWMHDVAFAERFAKALNHLRKLCGAKDDAF